MCTAFDGEDGSCVGYAYNSNSSDCRLYLSKSFRNCPKGFTQHPEVNSPAFSNPGKWNLAETSSDLIEAVEADWICYGKNYGTF